MQRRDWILVCSALPLALLIAGELISGAPLSDGSPRLERWLGAAGILAGGFLTYIAATTREIAATLARAPQPPLRLPRRRALVTDFAVHLDRSLQLDLRPQVDAPREAGRVIPLPAMRPELLSQVQDRLARIPTVRHLAQVERRQG